MSPADLGPPYTTTTTTWPPGGVAMVDWAPLHVFLLLLNLVVVAGNTIVIFVVTFDRKLRTVTTNKFIASLAVSDLLVGIIVMPLSLYSKVHGEAWVLGPTACQLHLVSGVFSSTASIVHLVAISLDRYFAIMFPTEYQRHSVSTAIFPYVVMIWAMALAVSSTLLMESKDANKLCWIVNPQYIVLSSLLSFFLPGLIVVYMYVKIFKKLRHHQLYMFGQSNTNRVEKKRSLPRVIIEEVRSRRGSRLSQTGSNSGSPTRRSSGGGSHKSERSPSQPEIHAIALPPQRWRSPTICAETFEHDRIAAAKKRVSIVPDPPSMDISSVSNMAHIRAEHESAKARETEMLAGPPSSSGGGRGKNNNDNQEGNEVLRKLSEERRMRRAERRKLSEEGRPNGIVPIMEAFDKAFAAVSNERRRLSLESPPNLSGSPFFSFHPSLAHPSVKPSLSTVCDEDSVSAENSTDDAGGSGGGQSVATSQVPSPHSVIVHVENHAEPVVAVKKASLTLPIPPCTPASPSPSPIPLVSLAVPRLSPASSDITSNHTSDVTLESSVDEPLLKHEEQTVNTPLLSVPLISNRRPSKQNGTLFKYIEPRLSCAGLIPPPTFLMVPAIMSINTPPLSPAVAKEPVPTCTLKVPKLYECPSPTACDIPPSNSSHSSYTSASGSSETYRRISMNSFGSSLTEGTDSTYEIDSRRSSAWSTLRAAVLNEPRRGKKSLVDMDIEGRREAQKKNAISRGKLRRIATQVTRAIRRKRRESLAIRRESRATRVVAAILVAFLMCWMPYYLILVYRGILTGCGIDVSLNVHHQLFVATSWLGYAHSAFNPVIYMCLNKNFRHTMRRIVAWTSKTFSRNTRTAT